MTEHKPRGEAISYLRIVEPQKVTPELAELQAEEKARKGYVRHGLTLPIPPAHLVASQRLANLLVRSPNGLLPFREREILAVVVSSENRCDVCTIQHATALEKTGASKELVDVLAVNWRRAPLSERERALAEFATKLTRHPQDADESYIDGLRAAGLSEEEIVEAAQVVGIFNFTNRVTGVFGTRLNPEAHAAYRRG